MAPRKKLPKTKIVYIAIKPSIARWRLAATIQEANAGIQMHCQEAGNCEFVDVWPPMLGEDGTPRKELFLKDGLYLNADGYAIWKDLVVPHLPSAKPGVTTGRAGG